ncbi:MAG: glycoside hydrolase 43 family protein [Vibrio sp.]
MDNQTYVWNPVISESEYQNPILNADYSDPDIIAVGDDYYMVASSFNHVPGLPILHSNDLVNWTIVNHAITAYPDSAYDKPQLGRGAWAPSIRYHDGLFYIFYALPDDGIFQCHTSDPRGKWSKPHLVVEAKGWIDPCPFWDDDGKAYLVHGFAHSRSGVKHKLQLFEMAPDATHLLDEGKIVYDGAFDAPTIEGPKFHKRNGWYYIFAPAGSVETGWQCVLRSKTIDGPYELKVVLMTGNTNVNGPHQGGWIETPYGECWFVHFQDRGYLGRVVHLQPMHWREDDWPEIGVQVDYLGEKIGQPVDVYPRPKCKGNHPNVVPQTSDDFQGAELGKQWQWQANPQAQWLEFVTDSNTNQQKLRLNVQQLENTEKGCSLFYAPHLLLQKFPHTHFKVETSVQANVETEGDFTGLVIYGRRFASLGLKKHQGETHLVMLSGWLSDSSIIHQKEDVICKWNGDQVDICVLQKNIFCTFGYRENSSQEYQYLEKPFICSQGVWVGAKMGLCALNANQASQGFGDFTHFTVSPLPE